MTTSWRLANPQTPFPKARLEELTKQVSREILDDYHRQRFEKEMRLGVSRPATAEPPVKKVPDEPPSVFLERVVTKLTEAMGPMAPLVLREHILTLGESSDSFPKARLEELAKQVSREILDDYHRQRFEKEMMKEIRRSSEHQV